MFYDCSKLKNLDLSSFDTQKVEKIRGIFHGVNAKITTNKLIFKEFQKDILFSEYIEDS